MKTAMSWAAVLVGVIALIVAAVEFAAQTGMSLQVLLLVALGVTQLAMGILFLHDGRRNKP
jgi:hypothetical protein